MSVSQPRMLNDISSACYPLEKDSEAEAKTSTSSYLAVRDIQDLLQVSEDTVRRMISRGDLAFVRAGRRVRIHREALEQWRREQEAKNKGGGSPTKDARHQDQPPLAEKEVLPNVIKT